MKMLSINSELHKKFKRIADEKGKKLYKATEEAIKDWIQKNGEQDKNEK